MGDKPDYWNMTVPGQQVGQSWQPLDLLNYEVEMNASTEYQTTYNIPNDGKIWTLAYVSGYTNSLEPIRTRIFYNTTLIGIIKQPAGFYMPYVSGALFRAAYPNVFKSYVYNHRATSISLKIALVFYKEL